MKYIVATIKPWNIAAFKKHKGHDANWSLITGKDDLNIELIRKIKPRYIFFPHWSWIVPEEILNEFECICFHETDVPYGRGGSPVQNLIARGHKDTKMTALKMVAEVDAGPVYLKKPLNLQGSAQDIFERAADMVYDMIDEITGQQMTPVPQSGETILFARRTPEMSELPKTGDAGKIYDHIRMLDAETYPPAFIKHGDFLITFKDAHEKDGAITAHVEIRKER